MPLSRYQIITYLQTPLFLNVMIFVKRVCNSAILYLQSLHTLHKTLNKFIHNDKCKVPAADHRMG